MTKYEQLPFISAIPVFAEVKEMMKSYFENGAIDDVLFPKWTTRCLRKFYRTAFPIREAFLPVSNYEACLPSDFKYVRELWMCNNVLTLTYRNPSSTYYQTDCRVGTDFSSCSPCPPAVVPPVLPCDPCDQKYIVTHKVTGVIELSYHRNFLLSPGNVNSQQCCGGCSPNLSYDSYEKFDIRDGKIILNVDGGDLHLMYYAENEEDEDIMIPDNAALIEYIQEYLIYMCFRGLSNLVTDESFNQIQQKLQQADQKQGEAYIKAEGELKKETLSQKLKSIARTKNRYNNFRIR